jgi:hypothetical protein
MRPPRVIRPTRGVANTVIPFNLKAGRHVTDVDASHQSHRRVGVYQPSGFLALREPGLNIKRLIGVIPRKLA